MEEKNKLHVFFKIRTLLFLTWICKFYIDMSIYNKFLNEKNHANIKIVTRNYRLLAKHKQGRRSDMMWKKEEIPNNREYEKKPICNNEKVSKGKNKLRNECSLNNARDYGKYKKCKSSGGNIENYYFGKRMLDKIYYKNKVRAAINSDFEFLRKDILLKLNVITVLFIFVVLYALAVILYRYFSLKDNTRLEVLLNNFNLHDTSIALLVIAIIVIPVVIYIGRKLIRNVKLKYKKCEINNTAYPSFRKVLFL
ncbi:hypothetical protein MKS88_001578 [Plasmodium brasilianum]|uniref:Uncharacterized protein n=1 Tax=Plasmodium brasilianum TaxID=5824 RepID=A0ACB9YFA4_PLABR|nr:hypothetical protein MKS88_001578 [Plasmodium brasilianum]